MKDPSIIERNFNEVICRERKLNVNSVKHPGPDLKTNLIRQSFVAPKCFNLVARDSRSFAEVAMGKTKMEVMPQ